MRSTLVNRVAPGVSRSGAATRATSPAPANARLAMPSDVASFTTRAQAAPPAAPSNPSAAPPAAPSNPPAAPLTDEEQSLEQKGLLPPEYAQLKAIAESKGPGAAQAQYQRGKTGPFSEDYGNPARMLNAAREIAKNPELLRLLKDTRKGDIILVSYNNPDELIKNVTKGPFTHAILCTQDGPPPEFIEAVGPTGDQNEPSNNKIRRSGFNEFFWGGVSYRKIRPAGHLPEPQRSKAIADAVRYAHDQLGKPYDYTFGQTAVGRAFICSSLAYYSYAKGAKLQIPVSKDSRRDVLVSALGSMVDSVEPKDRLALMTKVATMVARNPRPSEQEFVKVVVAEILPNCVATEKLADTPEERAGLEAAIARFRTGKGLPRYEKASRRVEEQQKAGRFDTPVLGFFRRQYAKARTAVAAASDVHHAFDGTGLSRLQALGAGSKLAWAALPYSEAIASFAFGPDDDRTKAFERALNTSEWLKNHKPFSWVSGWIPERGALRVNNTFISPTDLAWANLPHQDFNVKPGQPLDKPA